jgi:hypothetical protein
VNTRLTVADCREALYAEVDPSDPNTALFLPWLNEVTERFILSGKWKGALVSAVFPSDTAGSITLGPDFYSVLATRYGRWSGTPVFSQFHPYMENGPGEMTDTENFPGVLVDQGDGFPTTVSITEDEPGSLVIYSSGSDNGKTMRIFGIQQETGLPVYDNQGDEGEVITLAAPSVQSAYHYSSITGVQREATKGFVTMKLLPMGGGTEYTLSTYRPNEIRPMYRRYQCGTFSEAQNGENHNIHVICQRRWVKLVNETDWVIPGNLSALRYGLKMRYYEERQDTEKAEAAFQKGLALLNQEAKAARGGVRPDYNFSLFGDRVAFPWSA